MNKNVPKKQTNLDEATQAVAAAALAKEFDSTPSITLRADNPDHLGAVTLLYHHSYVSKDVMRAWSLYHEQKHLG